MCGELPPLRRGLPGHGRLIEPPRPPNGRRSLPAAGVLSELLPPLPPEAPIRTAVLTLVLLVPVGCTDTKQIIDDAFVVGNPGSPEAPAGMMPVAAPWLAIAPTGRGPAATAAVDPQPVFPQMDAAWKVRELPPGVEESDTGQVKEASERRPLFRPDAPEPGMKNLPRSGFTTGDAERPGRAGGER